MSLKNMTKLHYCNKKCSNTATCANIATRQVKLVDSSEKVECQYRCEKHATTPTVNKKVLEVNLFDQNHLLMEINKVLNTLIGKNIKSKMHTARELRVKYVKPNTGGVMCFQEHSKKWKFVYYNQIVSIL